jgi:hypothetical protein
MINKGITANHVTSPRMTNMPHAISKKPTRRKKFRIREPDLLKAASSKFSGIKEFLNTFGKKDGSNHQSNDERRDMSASLDDLLKHKFLHLPVG